MSSEKKPYIVLGEASESDEDDSEESVHSGFPSAANYGEGSEDDSHSEENITAAAFKAIAEEAKYKTLLHRKLRESNYKLKQDLDEMVLGSLTYACSTVGEIKYRLLSNTIEIQDTIKYLKKSSMAVGKVENTLSFLLTQHFLPTIYIDK